MDPHELLLANIRALRPNWPDRRKLDLTVEHNVASPVPTLDNRRRISGADANNDPDGLQFLASGYKELRNVVNIAEVWGLRFNSTSVVLDWGVGCGRIGRHIPDVLQDGFVGVDVDPINIAWCRENLPFGQYKVVATRGALPLSSDSVDLIYSHSVLTHLDEVHQDHWLSELARVLKPGGIMILTVHGMHSNAIVAAWAQTRSLWDLYMSKGFIDAPQGNPDIQDVTPHNYYRDVAHTPEYILRHWPERGVEVLDIMPGGLGPYQDVVVCTKG